MISNIFFFIGRISISKTVLLFFVIFFSTSVFSQEDSLLNALTGASNREKADAPYCVEITADKQPVGFSESAKPFTSHEVVLMTGDTIILFTDGYADQFG